MKPIYISIRLDFQKADIALVESIKALPGVVDCRRMYPDDPALSNILLAVVEPDSSADLVQTIAACETVDYVEVVPKPQPR